MSHKASEKKVSLKDEENADRAQHKVTPPHNTTSKASKSHLNQDAPADHPAHVSKNTHDGAAAAAFSADDSDPETITLQLRDIAHFCESNGVPVERLASLLPPAIMPRVVEHFEKASSEFLKSLTPKERSHMFEEFVEASNVLRRNMARCRSLARAFQRSFAFETADDAELVQAFEAFLDDYEDVRQVVCGTDTYRSAVVERPKRTGASAGSSNRNAHADSSSDSSSGSESDSESSDSQPAERRKSAKSGESKKRRKRRPRTLLPDDAAEMLDDRPDRPPSPGDGSGSGRWRPTDVMEITASASNLAQ